MTFEEMVAYLLETYPSDRYRGDELMDYITAEIKAAEARGAITPEVRERVYVMLWKIRGGARCGAAAAQGHLTSAVTLTRCCRRGEMNGRCYRSPAREPQSKAGCDLGRPRCLQGRRPG